MIEKDKAQKEEVPGSVPSYKKELGTRIEQVCNLVGGKKALADMLGMHDVQIHKYISGKNLPSVKVIHDIAKVANVSIAWLASGEGPMKKDELENPDWKGRVARPLRAVGDVEERIDPDDFYYVPMVQVELSAGHGAFVHSEGLEDYYAFRKDWLRAKARNPRQVVLMRVVGDSMEPTLLPNDTVMIDLLRRKVYDGCIYAIRLDDLVMIKTLQTRPGDELLIISDNKEEYPAITAKKKDVHIIGQIIWFARELTGI